jgi:hypothetical protein
MEGKSSSEISYNKREYDSYKVLANVLDSIIS